MRWEDQRSKSIQLLLPCICVLSNIPATHWTANSRSFILFVSGDMGRKPRKPAADGTASQQLAAKPAPLDAKTSRPRAANFKQAISRLFGRVGACSFDGDDPSKFEHVDKS